MKPFDIEAPFRHGTISKVGILLINLGTPEAPTAPALRKYLKQFLWDQRVVEIPRPLWWLILNGIILNTRPKQSAAKYATIWTKEGSPLRAHTEKQSRLVQGFLGTVVKSPLMVEYAMRYGEPAIDKVLANMRAAGCDRILIVPMYPQSAASSTGSAYDGVFAALMRTRNVPSLRLLKHFHDHPRYIAALAQSVRDFWTTNGRGEKLLMSFHGVPKFHLESGDPYHCECYKTARLLGEALELKPEKMVVTFQSRFGRTEWLKPYTMETLQELGKSGVKKIDVVCPGFIADCLETLEEIAVENKQAFLDAGGQSFQYIPCLNEREDWIKGLCHIIGEHLHGWVTNTFDEKAAAQNAAQSRQRALAVGAKN